jgi:hypothetical protein
VDRPTDFLEDNSTVKKPGAGGWQHCFMKGLDQAMAPEIVNALSAQNVTVTR